MTTASKLTIARVLLIPVFMAVYLLDQHWVALAVFIVASVTDLADGYIARHYDQVSDFGKFLDPLADKLLVFSAMLIFVQWGRMPSWAVMVILTRELAVSGLRMVAASKGQVLAAGWSGKIKTAATMAGLCVMMAFPGYAWLDIAATWVMVLTTIYSGVEYFVQNWKCLGLGKG
ncbi:MAG: CDP-diacylglycerol--glycerol-3-phosphate 3-phosphatidyltransferase [Oscillospiraceae bacterium]|nr:CDP-diacylglycerol--glycerol-3-phosphate 3-phosphatidyltransferase [Oscillospiraceae bacterium]